MSDPFSITGSAVGVISLGLGVCNEIVQYGRSYAGHREDIQQMAATAEAACAPLNVLKEIILLTETSQPETANNLAENVMRIDASISRLRDAVNRYGPTHNPDGSPDKPRNQARRATYYFRKDTLRDMRRDLDIMQATLCTLISAYNLKETICTRQENREIRLLIQSGIPPQSLLQAWYDAQAVGNSSIKSNKSVPSKKKALAQQGGREIKKGFSRYSRWLGLMITASLNISIDGGGGISIHPTLSVRFSVSNYEEIHQLLQEIVEMKDSESAILKFQDEFSNHRLHPSCVVSDPYYPPDSLIGVLVLKYANRLRRHVRMLVEIINFLLDIGVWVVQNGISGTSYLWTLQWDLHGCERDYASTVARIIDSGLQIDISYNPIGTFGISKSDNFWKVYLRVILSLDNEILEMPEITKTVVRRDAQGLRKALCEKQVLPKVSKPGDISDPSSLLHLAEGWGDGIKILLEFGADASQYFGELDRPGEEYYHSTAILLKAGCFFTKQQINTSYSPHDKGKRMHLLVNELKARREKLRILAEAVLPSKMIPVGGSLLDGPDALRVYELLISWTKYLTHPIPPKEYFLFNKYVSPWSVYHNHSGVECAEALYEAGFRATSMLDLNGDSPLGIIPWASTSALLEMIQWHISKDSIMNQQLPWTDESVAHLLIIKALWSLPLDALKWNTSYDSTGEHTKEHVYKLQEKLKCVEKIHRALLPFLSVPGGCSCPCSPGGLTTASLMCREYMVFEIFASSCYGCLRHTFEHLLQWDSIYGKTPLTFIRALTFNALDLTHTCFNKTTKGGILYRSCGPNKEYYINDNSNEPSAIEEFENLQAELELKFNELGLPLKDFVFKHWYRIVKDHLLTPPNPDEQYMCIADARNIGADLEQWEPSVPYWMTMMFAPKVEEVDEDKDGNHD